jgi:hypothetical protein
MASVLRRQTLCLWCAGKVVATVGHVLIKTRVVNLGLTLVIVTKTQGTCGNTVRSAATYVIQVRHGNDIIEQ